MYAYIDMLYFYVIIVLLRFTHSDLLGGLYFYFFKEWTLY